MPTDLAALLVQEGTVAAATLERALARQAEKGGALDTALLELGAIDEARLMGALSRATGLRPAPPAAWDAADARARRVFPSRVAERHGLAPFALDGRELSLVASYPVDLGLLDEISFMLSLHLTAHVGPEWRVRGLIHRLYGGPLDPRLAALADVDGAPAPLVDLTQELQAVEAAAAPEAGLLPEPEPAPAPAPEVEPEPAPAHDLEPLAPTADPAPAQPEEPPPSPPLTGFLGDDDGPLEPLAAALAQALESEDFSWLDEAVPELAPSAQPAAPIAPAAPLDRSAPPRWSLDQARAALASARTRDEVVLAALRYARDFFEFAALFAVTRDAVAGYDALGMEEDARDRCRGTAIYTSDPGIFRTVIETRAPYLGPVAVDLAGNEAILAGLGRAVPRTVLVAPVVLRDRTVCVLYADNGEAPVSARRLGDLLLFLATVGGAFERLIRERKAQRPGAATASAARPPSPAPAPAATTPTVKSPAPEAAPSRPAPPPSPPRAQPPAEAPRAPQLAPAPAAVVKDPVPVLAPESEPSLAPEADAAPAPEPQEHRIPAPRAPEEWRAVEPALTIPDFDIDVDDGEPEEPAPESEIDELIHAPAGSPRRAESIARLAAQGDAAVHALVEALPGPLDDEQAQEPARLGPVPAALSLHGASALPMLLAVLQEADPARRRCAAVLLGAAAEPAAFSALAERALDPDPRVAAAAASALARNRAHPAMRSVPDKLRRALLSGVAARTTGAARALAALRDVEAIPLLIQVLETSAGEAATAAAEALARITVQRIGPDPRRWLAWWKQNRGRGRAEWLFSGLTSDDREVRAAASAELAEAAPSPVQYDPDAPIADRAAAARSWAGWWSRSGRVL